MDEKLPIKNAPYSEPSLILGICSVLLGGPVCGVVLGSIGLGLARKGERQIASSTEVFGNIGLLKTGRIASIVGIVYGVLRIFAIAIACLLILNGTIALRENATVQEVNGFLDRVNAILNDTTTVDVPLDLEGRSIVQPAK